MSAETPVLQATDVHRTYVLGGHQLEVLRGLTLAVRPGERVFLCGKSGSGKTTLLYVLGGLERPDKGDVQVSGASLYQGRSTVRARVRNSTMGFVFQHFFLLPELTALENVRLPAMIGGRTSDARARELLARVGLAERMNHLPAELSGGEQQRVALARAFNGRPDVLFADEPTGNLDRQTGDKIADLLFSLNREHGTTLILVTHDPQLAARCDRRLRLVNGQLQEEA